MEQAATQSGTRAGPTLQTARALRVSYGHRILSEIGNRGPIGLRELFAEVGDLEDLFKSEREHRAAEERARQVVLFARRLGLVEEREGALSLTEVEGNT